MLPELLPVGRFRTIEWIEATGSTNDDLAGRIRAGEREPLVLITEEQLTGRGRRDRTWQMPRGRGLLLSVFVPWTDAPSVTLVPMALSLAATDAIGANGRSVSIKWPNDVVSADGRKIGGMLGEVIWADGNLVGAVVGLGLNVSWPAPGETGPPNAASLDLIGLEPADRVTLAAAILGRLDQLLDGLARTGPATVLGGYRSACATIGQMVRIDAEADTFEGTAVDVDSSGALVVSVGAATRVVSVADVVHLRPARPDPS